MADSTITQNDNSSVPKRKNCDRCAYCKVNRGDYPDLRFFRFPPSDEMCKKWLMASKLTSLLHVDCNKLNKKYRLCSRHFRTEDYATKKMHHLAANAVPSLFDEDDDDDIFSLNLKQLKAKYQDKLSESYDVESRPDTSIQAVASVNTDLDTLAEASSVRFLEVISSTSKRKPEDFSEEIGEEDMEPQDFPGESSQQKYRTSSVCVKMKSDALKENVDTEENNFIIVHEVYQCSKCFKMFNEESSLSDHECIFQEEIDCLAGISWDQIFSPDMLKSNCGLTVEQNVYNCDQCELTFSQKILLRKHRQVHKKKPKASFACIPCNLKFADKDSLRQHRRSHVIEKWFKCDQCDKRFAYEKILDLHFRKQHLTPKGPPQCEICDKIFSSRKTLRTHRSLHNLPNSKQFICEICNASFPLKYYLKNHYFSHSQERPHMCEKCGKAFKTTWSLRTHLKTHERKSPNQFGPGQYSGQRPSHLYKYMCHKCGKRFSTNFGLKTHDLIHTGEKPHKCVVCSRAFRHKALLKNHLFIHSNVRVTCDICDRQYVTQTAYKKHLKIHNDAKAIQCDACDMKFTSNWAMKSHYVIHTKEKPYECDLCHRRYSQKGSLKKHPCSRAAAKSTAEI